MLKIQIVLIAILIACVAFVSCDRTQNALKPADIMAADDMMVTDDMMDMMMDMMTDMTAHKSWAHVMLPVPPAEVTNPAESGAAHGMGTRTVYINDIGVMANKEGTDYPAGTTIVKEIMDDANTFVAKVAMMMKTDDPMYADHGGWMYVKYARPSADGEYGMVGGGSVEGSMGCAGCHAKADNDGVFVSLSMEGMMDDGMADDINADLNGDGIVDTLDYVTLASQIGQPVDANNMHFDVNGNGIIDASDIEALKMHFGAVGGMADDDMADDMMDDDMADDMMDDDMAGDDAGDDAGDTPVPSPPAVEAAPPVDDAQ
jgi:hypothetical protein